MHKLLRRVVYHNVIHYLGGLSIRIILDICILFYSVITISFRQNDALLCRHDVSSSWPKSAGRSACTPIINKCICLSNIIYIYPFDSDQRLSIVYTAAMVLSWLSRIKLYLFIYSTYIAKAAASRDRKSRFKESPFSLCDSEVSGTYVHRRDLSPLAFFGALNP